MNISEKLVNKILIHASEDWVMAANVVSIVISIEELSYKEERKIKEISIELIRKVVQEGLMTIGDYIEGGFKQWEIPTEEAIKRVENKWDSLGRNPRLGEVCWLSNTEKGNKIALDLIKVDNGKNNQNLPLDKKEDNSRKGKEKGREGFFRLLSVKSFRTCGTIVYVIGLIFALSFMILIWPESAAMLSWIIILGALAMIILPIIRRNYQLFKLGKFSQSLFIRKTVVDIVGILLTGIIAIVIAGASARFIGTLAGNTVEKSIPGLGVPAGIFSGITAAVLVGICVGYIAKVIWGRFTKLTSS